MILVHNIWQTFLKLVILCGNIVGFAEGSANFAGEALDYPVEYKIFTVPYLF